MQVHFCSKPFFFQDMFMPYRPFFLLPTQCHFMMNKVNRFYTILSVFGLELICQFYSCTIHINRNSLEYKLVVCRRINWNKKTKTRQQLTFSKRLIENDGRWQNSNETRDKIEHHSVNGLNIGAKCTVQFDYKMLLFKKTNRKFALASRNSTDSSYD